MAQILKAQKFTTNEIRQVSAALEAVYNRVNCADPEKRMRIAKRVVADILKSNNGVRSSNNTQRNWLIRNAEDILKRTYPEYTDKNVVDKSYSKGPDASFGKGPYNIKLPDPSSFSSYSDCVDRLTSDPPDGLNIDRGVAEQHCRSINPDAGQSGPSKTTAGDDGSSYVGRKTKTLIPPKGTITPAWASSILDAEAIKPTAPIAARNVKSASSNYNYNQAIYNTSISDILAERNSLKESKRSRLLQASHSEIPAHVRATCSDLI
jgi:hypothetical protein